MPQSKQSKNGNGNPLDKLRVDYSMPKGAGVGYKAVFKAQKEKSERELREFRQETREDLSRMVKLSTTTAERDARLIDQLMKRCAFLEREVKRVSGNGNGIPGIGFDPEAATGEKHEEKHEDDDDTHGA